MKEFEKNGIDVVYEYMMVGEVFYILKNEEFRVVLRGIKETVRSKYMR